MFVLRRAWLAAVLIASSFSLLLGASSIQAEAGVARGTTPGFVKLLAIPQPSERRRAEVEGGLYDLLYDVQILSAPGRQITFQRRAYEIADRSGLDDGGRIEIEFDPSYESLTLHRLAVVREGRAIDRTAAARVDIARRENELKNGILSGMLTAVVQVPGVRVGDVIDASWSWSGPAPEWPDDLARRIDLGWSVPLGLTHVRVIRTGTPLRIKRFNGAPAPNVEQLSGGATALEWFVRDPDPVRDDADSPSWWNPWPTVDVSSIPDWAAVVAQAAPRYAPGPLPPAFAARIDAIASETRDPAERAVRALRVVQDGIRYSSLSMGPGAVKPRTPDEVVRSGFGDCKDKARLLVTVLQRLGMKAWPALTDSDEGVGLPRRLPSEGLFDHVVVGVEIAGRTYWVDPTSDRQGGSLADQAELPYRFALPLRPGQAGLETVPWRPDRTPTMDVTEHFTQSGAGMSLVVDSRYLRDEADTARRNLAGKSRAAMERDALQYYAKRYPGILQRAPLAVADDRSTNLLVTRERYFIPATALTAKLLTSFPVNAYATAELYKLPKDGPRKAPFGLPFPLNRVHRIVLDTPGHQPTAPAEAVIDNGAFHAETRVKRDGSRLEIVASLFGKKPLLEPGEVDGYRDDVDRLDHAGAAQLDLTQEHAATALDGTVMIGLLVALAMIGIVATREVRQRNHPAGTVEQLYPVPIAKFTLMSLATWNLYAMWWQWRNWRHIAAADDRPISPFWRAFFSILFLYPLFRRANRSAHGGLPLWVGAAAAIGYAGILLLSSAGKMLPMAALAAGHAAPLFILPALIAVNRSSGTAEIARNGRWTPFAVLGLIVGGFTVVGLELVS